VLDAGRSRGLKIATSESGTGGLVTGALIDIPGCVDEATLAAHGAVSRETANAMAVGAIRRSIADLAVAITGIAGPAAARRKSRRAPAFRCRLARRAPCAPGRTLRRHRPRRGATTLGVGGAGDAGRLSDGERANSE